METPHPAHVRDGSRDLQPGPSGVAPVRIKSGGGRWLTCGVERICRRNTVFDGSVTTTMNIKTIRLGNIEGGLAALGADGL